MFLDDELLEMCTKADASTSDDIQKLYSDVMNRCESYVNSKVHVFMSQKELKTILNKTFNLFDSFVRLAKNSKNNKLNALGELFETYSFKRAFFDNTERKKIYESL